MRKELNVFLYRLYITVRVCKKCAWILTFGCDSSDGRDAYVTGAGPITQVKGAFSSHYGSHSHSLSYQPPPCRITRTTR